MNNRHTRLVSPARRAPVRARFATALLAGTIALSLVAVAPAQPSNRQTFEGPDPTWQRDQSDVSYRIQSHLRVRGAGRQGSTCEQLRITAGGGSYLYLRHAVGPAAVIEELLPSVWVRGDRGGVQLAVRVVLPRSKDPRSGQPLTVVLRGTSYDRAGNWQQLRVENLPLLLDRQVRMLRTTTTVQVDPREAYVDQMLLNVYTGGGTTTVSIDDLELDGGVGRASIVPVQTPQGAATPSDDRAPMIERLPGTDQALHVSPVSRAENPTTNASPAADKGSDADASYLDNAPDADQPLTIELQGAILLVNGRPLFPRGVEYRGEPLATLRSLGFNAVRLSKPPDGPLLDEARRERMWLICPPPDPEQLLRQQFGSRQQPLVGTRYDVVLAWDLGGPLAHRDLEAVAEAVRRIRLADRRVGRPIVGAPQSDLRAFSRHLNVLELSRWPLGTSLELVDYARWLQLRPRLALPGTPIWTTIQTQLAPRLVEQQKLLSGRNPSDVADPAQIRLVVYSALSVGVRGMIFESRSRLDAGDAPTRQRALTMALLNAELQLAEPWAAAGDLVTTASSNDPLVSAKVLEHDKARLVVPLRIGQADQYCTGAAGESLVSVIVPGIGESNQAWQLTPAGFPPLRRKRVTGGVLVTFDDFDATSLAVLTQNPLVLRSLQQRLGSGDRQTTEMLRELAAARLADVEQIDRRLASAGRVLKLSKPALAQADAALRECDRMLQPDTSSPAGATARRAELDKAYHAAVLAMRTLRRLQRAHWDEAAAALGSPTASPLAATAAMLPEHWDFVQRVRAAQAGPNLLPAGDFEDLQAMRSAGWIHHENPHEALRTKADVAFAREGSGTLALRLTVSPANMDQPPGLVESPPMWITSAPVAVRAGQLIRIEGQVRVPGAIEGSLDGLMIVDSIGGEALAERIGAADGWRPFVMYRAAARDEQLTLTFVLTGMGEAWLDDVRVSVVP